MQHDIIVQMVDDDDRFSGFG